MNDLPYLDDLSVGDTFKTASHLNARDEIVQTMTTVIALADRIRSVTARQVNLPPADLAIHEVASSKRRAGAAAEWDEWKSVRDVG